MKKVDLIPWLLAFFLIFSFSGTAFAGGGPEGATPNGHAVGVFAIVLHASHAMPARSIACV